MTAIRNKLVLGVALGVSAATLCVTTLVSAAPAAAATMRTEGPTPLDPIEMWAAQMIPQDQFLLYSNKDTELIRYKTPRDTEICVSRTDPRDLEDASKAIPVQVAWDNDVSTISPGNCMSFDARSVKIRPASPLPDGDEIMGTFRVMHH